jgi:hypothetical protein
MVISIPCEVHVQWPYTAAERFDGETFDWPRDDGLCSASTQIVTQCLHRSHQERRCAHSADDGHLQALRAGVHLDDVPEKQRGLEATMRL